MPPNTIIQPPDEGNTIASILRRLDRLERTSQLNKASVTDAAGVRRLQFGDFGDGNYGIRNWDASGNLIFDSLGLIGVMSVLGSSSNSVLGTIGPGVTGWQNVTTVGYSTARAVRVLCVGLLAAYVSDTGVIGIQGSNVQVLGDGSTASGLGAVPSYLSTYSNPAAGSATIFQTLALGAGSFTASLQWNAFVNTQTLERFSYSLYVFQLGS